MESFEFGCCSMLDSGDARLPPPPMRLFFSRDFLMFWSYPKCSEHPPTWSQQHRVEASLSVGVFLFSHDVIVCQIRLTGPPAGCLTPKLPPGESIGGWQMQTKSLSETSAACHLPCPDDGRSCGSCCSPVHRKRAQGQFQWSRTMQLGMVRDLRYAP